MSVRNKVRNLESAGNHNGNEDAGFAGEKLEDKRNQEVNGKIKSGKEHIEHE